MNSSLTHFDDGYSGFTSNVPRFIKLVNRGIHLYFRARSSFSVAILLTSTTTVYAIITHIEGLLICMHAEYVLLFIFSLLL